MTDLSQRTSMLALGSTVVIAAVAYWTAFESGYFSDDFHLLAFLRDPLQIALPITRDVEFWTYRPIGHLSMWAFDVEIFGRNALASHLLSFTLHVVNTLLVFDVTRRLLADERKVTWIATAAACLFLLYPRHSEAVVLMNSRHDLFAALFGLASLSVLLRAGSATPRLDWGTMASSLLFLLLALLSKEAAVAFIPVLLLVAYFHTGLRGRSIWELMMAYGMVCLVYGTVRLGLFGSVESYAGVHSPFRVVAGFGVQLTSLVVPGFWDFLKVGQTPGTTAAIVLMTFAGWGLLFVLTRVLWRHGPLGKLLLFFMVVSLFPAAGLFTLKYYMNDRLLYIASIWLCIGSALALATCLRRPTATLVCIMSAFTIMVWMRAQDFYASGVLRDRLLSNLSPTVVEVQGLRLYALPDSYRGVAIFRNGYEHISGYTRESGDLDGVIMMFVESPEADLGDPILKHNSKDSAIELSAKAGFTFRNSLEVTSRLARLGLQASFTDRTQIDAARNMKISHVVD